MTDPDNPDEPREGRDASPDATSGTSGLLEPNTTGKLVGLLRAPKRAIRAILRSFSDDSNVRKKEPETNRFIRVRGSPTYECPNCGYGFQLKYRHPVLASVRLCPRCGTRLER